MCALLRLSCPGQSVLPQRCLRSFPALLTARGVGTQQYLMASHLGPFTSGVGGMLCQGPELSHNSRLLQHARGCAASTSAHQVGLPAWPRYSRSFAAWDMSMRMPYLPMHEILTSIPLCVDPTGACAGPECQQRHPLLLLPLSTKQPGTEPQCNHDSP